MAISNEAYRIIQIQELGYWTHTPYPPDGPWRHYDKAFIRFLDKHRVAVDVGCGPVPYLFNHNVRYDVGFAVDPLIEKYYKIPRYRKYWDLYGQDVERLHSLSLLEDGIADAVYGLNVLDHVQDVERLLEEIYRKMAQIGVLYLYVDVGKKPDKMHPHMIDADELLDQLDMLFVDIWYKIQPSWKFDNQVLFYVGGKK